MSGLLGMQQLFTRSRIARMFQCDVTLFLSLLSNCTQRPPPLSLPLLSPNRPNKTHGSYTGSLCQWPIGARGAARIESRSRLSYTSSSTSPITALHACQHSTAQHDTSHHSSGGA